MNEKQTIDLTNYEKAVEELVQKLQFPPAPTGQPMPDAQKRMMVIQMMSIALMS